MLVVASYLEVLANASKISPLTFLPSGRLVENFRRNSLMDGSNRTPIFFFFDLGEVPMLGIIVRVWGGVVHRYCFSGSRMYCT